MSSLLARAGRLLAVLGLALTAGCAGLPTSGSVRTEQIEQQVEDGAPVDFTPGAPEEGAEPVEIVRGFLIAMQATPINTTVARQFLTAEGSQGWVPERGTIVYSSRDPASTGSRRPAGPRRHRRARPAGPVAGPPGRPDLPAEDGQGGWGVADRATRRTG